MAGAAAGAWTSVKKFSKNNKGKLAVGGALLAGLVGAEIGSELTEGFGDMSFEGGGGEDFGGGGEDMFGGGGGGEEYAAADYGGGEEYCAGGDVYADTAYADTAGVYEQAALNEQMFAAQEAQVQSWEAQQASASLMADANANAIALI
jgi:hypothetical protein